MSRVHGSYVKYVQDKCRCDECRAANRDYVRARKRRTTPAYVAADASREHVAHLSQCGIGLKAVATISGVSHGCLSRLVYGLRGRGPSKRVTRRTHDAILAVHPEQGLDGSRAPAGEAWEIVGTLLERGWTRKAIGQHVQGPDAQSLQLGRKLVTRKNLRILRGLLDLPVPPRRSRYGLLASAYDPQAELAAEVDRHHQADRRAAHRAAERDETPDRFGLPVLSDSDVAWMAKGACRRSEIPTWLFFPAPSDVQTLDAAREVCAACPVYLECRRYAIENGMQGVWGGTSTSEREQTTEKVA